MLGGRGTAARKPAPCGSRQAGQYLPLLMRCKPPPGTARSVRWHMASVGSETDLHNLHLHGNTFLKCAALLGTRLLCLHAVLPVEGRAELQCLGTHFASHIRLRPPSGPPACAASLQPGPPRRPPEHDPGHRAQPAVQHRERGWAAGAALPALQLLAFSGAG